MSRSLPDPSWRPPRVVIGAVGRGHGLDGFVHLVGHGPVAPMGLLGSAWATTASRWVLAGLLAARAAWQSLRSEEEDGSGVFAAFLA